MCILCVCVYGTLDPLEKSGQKILDFAGKNLWFCDKNAGGFVWFYAVKLHKVVKYAESWEKLWNMQGFCVILCGELSEICEIWEKLQNMWKTWEICEKLWNMQ